MVAALAQLPWLCGCELYVADADRDVYRLTRRAQLEALGADSDVHIGDETGRDKVSPDAYDFSPRSIDSEVPEEFLTSAGPGFRPQAEEPGGPPQPIEEVPEDSTEHSIEGEEPPPEHQAPEADAPPHAGRPDDAGETDQDQLGPDERVDDAAKEDSLGPPEFTDRAFAEDEEGATIEELMGGSCNLVIDDLELGQPMGLVEVIQYAHDHSRDLQAAKEDLYLQALALTLERHLWTPRFMSRISSTYRDARIRDEDNTGNGSVINQTLELMGDLALEQRLPYGGQIVATYMASMIRDVEEHVTNAESGSVIIQADIPLLRGAGPAAYESRYRAERDLIYEVRAYERFRRNYVVDVASAYFRLQSQRASLRNAILSRSGFRETLERSLAFLEAEKAQRVESDRARSQYLVSCSSVIDRMQAFESALDNFKILIGMPTTVPLDIIEREEMELSEPAVVESEAIETALSLRLDLLTTRDQVEDAQRGLAIARNNMLPDLDFRGALQYSSNPDHHSVWDLREDTRAWSVGLDLEVPIDRKAERNQLRASIILLRRSERDVDLAEDRVRRDVRLAMRRIRQAQLNLVISRENVRTTDVGLDAARTNFFLGLQTNQAVVDAENDLRTARDDYASADAALREAILRLRLETGTLRIREDGFWLN